MTRMLTLLLLLATGVHAQVQPTDWRFAQPNADIVASINIQTLLKSPMIATLKDQVPKESQAQVNMAVAMLSGIERVSVSARQTAPKAGAAASASDSEALILINGSFDAQMLQLMLGGAGAGPGGMQVKQVDPHTVLVGQEPSFTQALARLSGKAADGAPGRDELESNDLFIGGDLARLVQQQTQSTPPALQGVRRFAFGMNAGDPVDFSLILTTADASDVQLLMKTFHDLMAQSGQTPEQAAMMAKAFDMRQDGAKLRVHFVPPPEMIKAAQQAAASGDTSGGMGALQALLGGLGIPGGSPAAAPKTNSIAPPPPSNGGKIIINGLDDGPRVVAPQ